LGGSFDENCYFLGVNKNKYILPMHKFVWDKKMALSAPLIFSPRLRLLGKKIFCMLFRWGENLDYKRIQFWT